MENMRVLIDRLEQQVRARSAGPGSSSTASSGSPSRPGLSFQPGDKVLDLATGRKGTVVDGIRDEATGRQVYQLTLLTGETVTRSLSELGRDVAAIAPRGNVG